MNISKILSDVMNKNTGGEYHLCLDLNELGTLYGLMKEGKAEYALGFIFGRLVNKQ